jgi:hypothetical protein
MLDIRHRVGIIAPVERVYRALATTDGLSGAATPYPEDMKISSWG